MFKCVINTLLHYISLMVIAFVGTLSSLLFVFTYFSVGALAASLLYFQYRCIFIITLYKAFKFFSEGAFAASLCYIFSMYIDIDTNMMVSLSVLSCMCYSDEFSRPSIYVYSQQYVVVSGVQLQCAGHWQHGSVSSLWD